MRVLYKSSADNWRILFVLKTTLIATRFYVFAFVVVVVFVFCLKQISYVLTAAGRNSTQGQAWVRGCDRVSRRPHTSAQRRFYTAQFGNTLITRCTHFVQYTYIRSPHPKFISSLTFCFFDYRVFSFCCSHLTRFKRSFISAISPNNNKRGTLGTVSQSVSPAHG